MMPECREETVAEVEDDSLPDILSLALCAPHRLPFMFWCAVLNALWWSRYSMAPEGDVGVPVCQSLLSA